MSLPRRLAAMPLIAVLCATPLAADESWMSDMGQIVYETEENGAAILSFVNVDGYAATLVLPGLAGNYDARGVHEGFWIGTGAGWCDAFLARPGGQPSTNWGRAMVAFDNMSFPTGFTLSLGDCFGPYTAAIRADLP